jgi:hypothetical protein
MVKAIVSERNLMGTTGAQVSYKGEGTAGGLPPSLGKKKGRGRQEGSLTRPVPESR